MTAEEIFGILRTAGATPLICVVLTAIALRESAGVPTAHNANAKTGDDSYGLFQINMIGQLGVLRLKRFGLSRADQLLDPTVSAQCALKIWNGDNANLNRAWYIDKPGYKQRYEAHLPAAIAAALTRNP
jgi:hypothetical protein